ncbi:MAG TPA: ABC transporter permease, partial [Alphaproteobacteria bacterium]|nr:ABC transporter permease [Alphaproteobacteria bacterium]
MLARLRRYGTLVGFAVIVVVFWVNLPDTFMTARNWLNITQQLSMLTVVAAGMTIVMVMGDFDLSVGSMASLAGIVAAILFAAGYPVWAAVGIALLVGLLGGALNGALVSLVGILPFVATLATLTMFSGAAFVVSGGKTISGRAIPEAFASFAREGLALGPVTIPNLTIVAALTVLVVWVLLEQTTFGRRLYAIGGNIEAAHLSGVA